MSDGEERYARERARIEQGHVKYREKLKTEGKLFVRDRLKLLLDPVPSSRKTGCSRDPEEAETPADGVVTGVGTVGGRAVCIMANDYTVKAGSWGEKTVQKIVRIQEKAARLQVPILYLVDAAGGRISEQIRIFPGRYHAGRIFYNEVQLSGVVPQVCILFGPSPAGSAYLPALTDLVIMVDGKASLYVGSPRMVEMAVGEKTTLEELGRGPHALQRLGLRRRAGSAQTKTPSSWPSDTSRTCPRPTGRTPPTGRSWSRSRAAPSMRSCPTISGSTSTCTR